jgi:predicted RNA-binding protein YlqC (UPF0109 family)
MGKELNAEGLVLRIVNALVDETDQAHVTSVTTGAKTIFEVSVGSSDVGKIIGKNGRTARAIRELLIAMGTAKMRYGLDVVTKRDTSPAQEK